jgi:large repetitive protein
MSFLPRVPSKLAPLCVRLSLVVVVFMSLLLPAMASPPLAVSYTGPVASQNFGSISIGTPSTVSLSFSMPTGITVGSIEVVTQGAPNLDFTNAGSGTCAEQTYGSTTSCTVEVTFTPIYAGLRRGAVLFWSGSGNTGSIIGKTFIYGVGDGGQIIYGPPVITAIPIPSGLGSLNGPGAVTFDGTGDLYVADSSNNRMIEIPVTGTAMAIDPNATSPSGFSLPSPEQLQSPEAAEVDGAGDLFIADNLNQRMVEVPDGGGAAFGIDANFVASNGGNSQITLDFTYPGGFTIDGLGNLYIADEFDYRVDKLSNITSAGTGTGSTVNLGSFSVLYPIDVWMDAAGDLFIADFGEDPIGTNPAVIPQVLEVLANGTVQKVATPGCTLQGPVSVEGDAAGNLFIGDEIVNSGEIVTGARMIEVPAGGGNCIVTSSAVGEAFGASGDTGYNGIGQVNLNAAGDIYISDWGNDRVIKMQRSVAPTVAFTHPTAVGIVDSTDGTKTVQITNIGNEELQFSELAFPADFAAGSGVLLACTSSSTIAINGTCNVGIEFDPQNAGSLSESVTLIDNAQNGSQSITVTGDATGTAPSITSASSTTFTVGSSGSFTVTASGSPSSTFSETGALPSGVTLSSAGILSGTPTGTSGTYPITITASNGVGSNATQSFTLSVNPGPVTHLVIPGGPEPFYTAFGFTISAYDAAGNLATSYNGTVTFSSSDPGFVNLGPVTLVNGTGSQSGVLKTAGTDSITATDTTNPSITGTGFFTVQPGVATHFGISAPPSAYVGAPISYTLTAYDLYGNVATSYGGTVVFTSTDLSAILPGSSAISNGTGIFSATMETVGLQTITATDAGNSLTATSGNISVTLPNLVVTTAADDVGTASNCTIQTSPGTGTDSSCSLRDALLEAANLGSSSLSFDSTAFASAQTITLGSSGSLAIPSNTTITGPTSGSGVTLTNLVTIAGGGSGSSFSVFTVNPGVTASTLSGLTITSGFASYGGGIYNSGTLTVSNSTLTGNSAVHQGGGIYNNAGTLTVLDSTFSANSTTSQGGAGIYNLNGTLTVNYSSFSSNISGGNGGAIIANSSVSTVTNSSFSGNSAPHGDGGAIYVPAGVLTASNNIFYNNSALGGGGIYNSATANAAFDLFYNNVGNGVTGDDCHGCSTNSNQVTTNPNLTPLGNYGGPTQAMVPMPGSGAICAASSALIPAGITTDQRGYSNSKTYGAISCNDLGAVQSNYALSFTAEPPSAAFVSEWITPAPTVGLTESGTVAALPTSAITVTDSDSLLFGSNTANLSSGTATFNTIGDTSLTASDTLTASLSLNPSLAPALNLSVPSTTFQVITPTPATLTSPTPSTLLTSASVTLTWSGGLGVQDYSMVVGTTGVGSGNVYISGVTSATSLTVTVPTTGATLYVRLRQLLSSVWLSTDYTYTEAGAPIPAAITSPAPGTTLTSASVTFEWPGSNVAKQYQLTVGTTGPTSNDVYSSGVTTATSETVTAPTTGAKLYVSLGQLLSGVWQWTNYTYTEGGAPIPAAITSPTPSSTLTSASVAFEWPGSNVAKQYQLIVGTTGPTSNNVYNSGVITATSETVTVPTTGAKLYVSLGQLLSGVWQWTNYTYTETQ